MKKLRATKRLYADVQDIKQEIDDAISESGDMNDALCAIYEIIDTNFPEASAIKTRLDEASYVSPSLTAYSIAGLISDAIWDDIKQFNRKAKMISGMGGFDRVIRQSVGDIASQLQEEFLRNLKVFIKDMYTELGLPDWQSTFSKLQRIKF